LNYTNVCITYCKFCVFYRQPGHEEAYTLSLDEVVRRIVKASELFGITQVLIQGGHNPNLKIEYYEEIFKAIKEVLSRLKAAGLDSIPGFSECIL
jgi:cyclic dehypoxanthinyl futalosine synthase